MASLTVLEVIRFGTTGGLEPLFMESFMRRKKGNPGDKDFRSDFEDENGDHWMHFSVDHPGLELFKLVNPTRKTHPYQGACAEDINWVNRVKMQGMIQQHVDHSISSTVNLPSDVSVDEVNRIYIEAWKTGCKGITVYRKGCRDGVLIEKKEDLGYVKRPKELPCDVHHITVRGNPYCVLVGLIDGNPYEIFAFRNGYLDKKVKTGKIVKKGRPKCYKAELEDGMEICPLGQGNDEMEAAVTRLVSMALRHGAGPQYVVQQLEKVGGDMTNFAKSISRAMKKYIADGSKEKGKCNECGAEALIRQEGCIACSSCGYSKC
jgi:ribonucleoside-diphosphate reductase alpha chain